jgi:hypothetical protein
MSRNPVSSFGHNHGAEGLAAAGFVVKMLLVRKSLPTEQKIPTVASLEGEFRATGSRQPRRGCLRQQ